MSHQHKVLSRNVVTNEEGDDVTIAVTLGENNLYCVFAVGGMLADGSACYTTASLGFAMQRAAKEAVLFLEG